MRLYIWEELFWNHTSGTVYATLHLGRGLERNNTSGTNFIRYSLGRGLEKEQHIWERFYPLQYELTSGRNRKRNHTSGFFPFINYEYSVRVVFGTRPRPGPGRTIPRYVEDSIQAINGQNADKIIGLTLFVCFM